MDDFPLENRDDEINIEEITEKIREKIRIRQEAGEQRTDSEFNSTSDPKHVMDPSNDPIGRDLIYIKANWDIHNNNYFISSHRPYIGNFVVKGRQLIHGEVRRYVDPIISRQTEFNASSARSLAKLTQMISRQNEEVIADIQKCVNTKFDEVFSRIDKDLQLRIGLIHLLEERTRKELVRNSTITESVFHHEANYFLFEERFRGPREDIKKRQSSFLPFFENSSLVLDIGCGRGEFLEILRDNNIGGIGVDVDGDMVAYCKSRQLEVAQGDAITYLEDLDHKSLDGIFIDQVVEHLEPDYLVRLLALCYQKLKSGHYIVVETVNPLSFVSFVNFYIDPTHKRPVHPETLQFLMNAAGFQDCEKKFFSPVSEEENLKKITDISQLDETNRKNVDIYNHNIETLNAILFGAQDYAVIGRK